jgi:ribose transport system permease protein
MSATETAPQTEQAPRQRRVVRGGTVAVWAERSALPVAWAALIIIYSILAPSGTFDTWSNVTSILSSQAVLFTLALAALMPSFVGDFDLSLGGIMGLTGMVVGVLNSQDGVNIVLACLVGMAVAVLAGAVNAFFVVTCDTNPLIITLGSGSVFIGLIYMMGSGNTITIASSGVTKWTYSTTWLNIPAEFYYGLGLMLIIWYVSASGRTGCAGAASCSAR